MEENSRLLTSDPKEEIVFVSPHEKGSQAKVVLTNPGEETVFFKVLTTDPLAFCVKPKMGSIKPTESLSVCITLRCDDPNYYSNKQPKFKVLTVEGGDSDPKGQWPGDKSENPSSLRFICNFLDANNIDKENKEESCESSSSSVLTKVEKPEPITEPVEPTPNTKTKTKSNFMLKYMILGAISILIASITAAKMFLTETTKT